MPPGLLFNALGGRAVTLSKLFPDKEGFADAVKRARTVRNKANAHYEERGLETLYLAVGMATWSGQKSAATPAAPVLLVPVRLAPKGAAQEEFELSVTGELEVNPTFLQLLKSEFSIDCNPADLLDSSGIEGIIDTPAELTVTFEWLRDQCRSVPVFEVKERFVIGNFSYAKLPMVRDLEGSLEAMAEHDLIAALAGDPEAQESLRQAGANATIPSPDYTPPKDEFLVLDADSSQNYAINAVLAGRSLIIKGPPGTGKSQTISNLISTLVARGKRVLFVAEKRAAIDAVLRRLDEVGLGDLILNLHGGVSSRRQTAQALAVALTNNSRLPKPDLEAAHHRLEQKRSQLSGRVEALHDLRSPWGISFFEVQSQLLSLPTEAQTDLRFRGQELERLSDSVIADAEQDLGSYVGLGGLALSRSGSAWARATVVSSNEAEDLQRRVETLRSQLTQLLPRLRQGAAEITVREPQTLEGWGQMLDEWARAEQMLRTFDPRIYGLELARTLSDCEPLSRSRAARTSATITNASYRAARNELRAQLLAEVKLRPSELWTAATQASELLERWQSISTDPLGTPRSCSGLDELQSAFDSFKDQLASLESGINAAPADDSVAAAQAFVDGLLRDVETLGKLPELHRLRSALEARGLEPLLLELEPRDIDGALSRQALQFAWLSSIREHLQLTDSRIGAFDGEQHRHVVAEYQQADREHIETTAQRVRRRCAEQATAAQDANQEGAALIRSEAAKKRKHLPIRQLFSAAPDIMTSLKPCWVMSPLVVSQILPSDRPHFDVVVFDEASQVRPAEALPAILRGRQLVVAGDERQLPPTAFFAATSSEEEDPAGPEAALSVDGSFESILEAMDPFVGFKMLEWHYRSRDERLIAFSNAHLYDHGLTTFPGIVGPDCIQHVHVLWEPGRPDSDVSSGAEVAKVVELILEHAELRPEQSLGVIAMGIKHAERIDEALRAALSERDDLEEFFEESSHEPFFVKNLERVQGDERDAIILSVGYGKNDDGRLLYRFGPLNQEGGERRLNVAITRAKERMTLVSSFTHLDMDPERSTAKGVELLRAYLEYCACNGAHIGDAARDTPELNPFEVDIRDHLTRAGLQLIPQYGASGYRIDFAVKHPIQPGRMVLAIECDGASYHSAQTARDRDRLRQEQLERLGWIFHRIWSQDWFNNKEREIERAEVAYQSALKHANERDGAVHQPSDQGSPDPGLTVVEPETIQPLTDHMAKAARSKPNPIQRRGRKSIAEYTQSELVAMILSIESDGLLRTKVELRDEMIRELGFQRRGPRIVAAVESAIDVARQR